MICNARLLACLNLQVWNEMVPGLASEKIILIKNGQVLVTSIETGFLSTMSAEEYVNEHCSKMLINSIYCPNYIDTWATGRKYNIAGILKGKEDDFRCNHITLKFVTLIKAVASDSIKEGNKNNVYFIQTDLDEWVDFIELSDEESFINSSKTYTNNTL